MGDKNKIILHPLDGGKKKNFGNIGVFLHIYF